MLSRVNWTVFFPEFSYNTESIILSPERLAIIEDFSIHVDAPRDLESRKLRLISWALATCLGRNPHTWQHLRSVCVTAIGVCDIWHT